MGQVTYLFSHCAERGFNEDQSPNVPPGRLCRQRGGRFAAIVAGAMNMIGAVGGALANWATGWILQRSLAAHAAELGTLPAGLSPAERITGELAGYQINFVIFAAVFVVGIVCWLRIDAARPITAE